MSTLAELRRIAAARTKNWDYYNNSFDAGIVIGLRKALPGEHTTFNCGLRYDRMIFGGEPSEGRIENDNNTQFAIAAERHFDQLLDIAEAAESIFEIIGKIGSLQIIWHAKLPKLEEALARLESPEAK